MGKILVGNRLTKYNLKIYNKKCENYEKKVVKKSCQTKDNLLKQLINQHYKKIAMELRNL